MNYKKLTMQSLALLATGLFVVACGDDSLQIEAEDLQSTLTIENASDYAFIEINLSPVDSGSWGSDVLASEILWPGEAVEIGAIDCDSYDIRVLDEDNDECIIEDVDLCLNDETWTIDNVMLSICTTF